MRSDPKTMAARLHDLFGAIARLHQVERQVPLPGARANDQAAVRDCVREVLVHARGFENIVGTRGARRSICVWEELRPH